MTIVRDSNYWKEKIEALELKIEEASTSISLKGAKTNDDSITYQDADKTLSGLMLILKYYREKYEEALIEEGKTVVPKSILYFKNRYGF